MTNEDGTSTSFLLGLIRKHEERIKELEMENITLKTEQVNLGQQSKRVKYDDDEELLELRSSYTRVCEKAELFAEQRDALKAQVEGMFCQSPRRREPRLPK
jgi:hypothetical protein